MSSIGRERQDKLFEHTCSKPKTLADLPVGAHFVVFPKDGDDSGHDGFRGGGIIYTKIEPYHAGIGYHASYLYTAKDYRCNFHVSIPLDFYVIQILGA